jgi:hypothetical protein
MSSPTLECLANAACCCSMHWGMSSEAHTGTLGVTQHSMRVQGVRAPMRRGSRYTPVVWLAAR